MLGRNVGLGSAVTATPTPWWHLWAAGLKELQEQGWDRSTARGAPEAHPTLHWQPWSVVRVAGGPWHPARVEEPDRDTLQEGETQEQRREEVWGCAGFGDTAGKGALSPP